MRKFWFFLFAVSLLLNLYLLWEKAKTGKLGRAGESSDSHSEQITLLPGSVSNIPEELLLSEAVHAFEKARFAEAVELYKKLSVLDAALSSELKHLWLAQVSRWVNKDASQRASEFIEAFKKIEPNEPLVLWLEARAQVQAGDLASGVLSAYQALSGLSKNEQYQEYLQWIHHQAVAYADDLTAKRRWKSLEEFAQSLLWHEPQADDYNYYLALALIQQARFGESLYPLQVISADSMFAEQAMELRQRVQLAMRDKPVPLQRYDKQFAVQVKISADDGVTMEPVTFLIDTGASMTVLTEQSFKQLSARRNAQYLREVSMQTAGGMVKASVYQFSTMQLGAHIVAPFEVAVMPFSMKSHDGLLGMNVLSRYKFQIDQRQSHLVLMPR